MYQWVVVGTGLDRLSLSDWLCSTVYTDVGEGQCSGVYLGTPACVRLSVSPTPYTWSERSNKVKHSLQRCPSPRNFFPVADYVPENNYYFLPGSLIFADCGEVRRLLAVVSPNRRTVLFLRNVDTGFSF